MCKLSLCLQSLPLPCVMAVATTMDVAGQHAGFPEAPPGAASLKRKWWGIGAARQSNPRYNKNIHKVVKQQGQGLKLQKKRRFKRRSVPRTVPRAPYNDSSFLMRVRKAGGLESLVALTPSSFMSTPKDSSYKLDTCEDVANLEDYGYGSMTGLIRLRPGAGDEDRSSGSSTVDNNSDVELSSVLPADSVEQLEQRLDRGVSRFEMRHPSPRELDVLKELRVTRQECHIKCLEDENLVLKDRLFLMQQEINELRRRLEGGEKCDVDVSDESDDSQSCLGR